MSQENKLVKAKVKLDNLAFTLVELIVVITILAILGTIAFISLQGYSKQARDSRRISDISNIKTSLEIFSINTGYYPEPDNVGTAYYSGETVFTQGKVGDNVTSNLSRNLNKKPTDPLFDTEYTYSTTVNKKEYELLSIFEGDVAFIPNLPHPSPLLKERELSGISPLPSGEGLGVRSSYASDTYQVKVDGTYNKIFTQTTNYIVPIPSIVTSEELPFDLEVDGYKINSMVVNGGRNMPNLGIPNIETHTGRLSMTLSVTGVIDDNSSDEEKLSVIESIQAAYDGSDIGGEIIYQNILSKTSNEDKLNIVEYVVLNESAGGSTEEVETLGCATNPGYSNATYTAGEATEVDQAWQNTDSESPCYYECNSGYGGSDCNTEMLITQSECDSANWFWVSGDDDVYIGQNPGNGFCISPRLGDFVTSCGGGISFHGWGHKGLTSATTHPRYCSYRGWDTSSVDDTGNTYNERGQTRRLDSRSTYSCKELGTASSSFDTEDTIVGRMKWLVSNKTSLSAYQSIDWVQNALPPNDHPIPALYIADCIDGVKDLAAGTQMTYTHNDGTTDVIDYNTEYNANESSYTDEIMLSNTIYQNRQKYLTAWTQQSGSHIPSAFSYISSGTPGGCEDVECNDLTGTARGEYQVACEAGLLTDSDDGLTSERIWLSAIGGVNGNSWGNQTRIMQTADGCGTQNKTTPMLKGDVASTRIVIRP